MAAQKAKEGAGVELGEAFERLQSDPALAEKFVEDPEGVLTIMGVDTSGLVIQPTVGTKDPFKTASELRQGTMEPAGLTICASIGYIICATVGGEVPDAPWKRTPAPWLQVRR